MYFIPKGLDLKFSIGLCVPIFCYLTILLLTLLYRAISIWLLASWCRYNFSVCCVHLTELVVVCVTESLCVSHPTEDINDTFVSWHFFLSIPLDTFDSHHLVCVILYQNFLHICNTTRSPKANELDSSVKGHKHSSLFLLILCMYHSLFKSF